MWLRSVLVGLSLLLCAGGWGDGSTAELMDAARFRQTRNPALVYFHGISDGQRLGYGVVVDASGHVLTVKHNLSKRQKTDIVARLASADSQQTYKLESLVAELPGETPPPEGEDDKEALWLLKFEKMAIDATVVPPVANPREYETSDEIRVITGTLQNPQPEHAPGHPRALAVKGLIALSIAGVGPGNSGSPAYDRTGNLIGIVTDGELTSRANIRSSVVFRGWLASNLEKNGVALREEMLLPDRIAIYVTLTTNLASEVLKLNDLYAVPLNTRLIELSTEYLGTQPDLIAYTEQPFEEVAKLAFEPNLSPADGNRKISEYLNDPARLGPLRAFQGGFARLYLVVFQLDRGGLGGYNGSHRLIVIDNQSSGVKVRGPTEKQLKPLTAKPDDVLLELAVKMLHAVIGSQPNFGANKRIWANCIEMFPPPEGQKKDTAVRVPWLIAAKMKKMNMMNGYTIDYPKANCDKFEPKHQLSQMILQTKIEHVHLTWTIKQPWKPNDLFEPQSTPPIIVEDGHLSSVTNFDQNIAGKWLSEIGSHWPEVVKKFHK